MVTSCPVCGTPLDGASSAGTTCLGCGFEYAGLERFAGPRSLELWRRKVAERRAELRAERAERLSRRNWLVVGGRTVAYVSPDSRRLWVLEPGESVRELESVRQYDRSVRNAVILFEDGTVRVEGDDTYGQRHLAAGEPIEAVCCGPESIYAVGRSGRVRISGVVVDEAIATWRDVTAVACGSYHVVGLTRDKTVRISRRLTERPIVSKVEGWRGVKAVCAVTNCSLALFEDGTVSFAGREGDPRSEAEEWKDIVSLKADGTYVVGLTRDGTVRLAGSTPRFLDLGRSQAATWEDVVAIACSQSVIAGAFLDGSLRIVGSFSGDIPTVCREWKDTVSI